MTIAPKPMNPRESVVRAAPLGREFDRSIRQRQRPLQGIRGDGADVMAEAEGVDVHRRETGECVRIVRVPQNNPLETGANPLE